MIDLVQSQLFIVNTWLHFNTINPYQILVVFATGGPLPVPALAFTTDGPADPGSVVAYLNMER